VRSLYTRLLSALLGLLFLISGMVLLVSAHNARNYRLEVTQELHLNLAESLVGESLLMSNGIIHTDAVKGVFHTLMVINPSIEVYLLDATGKLLSYSAPEGKVKLGRVSLDPVRRFLSQERELPIVGEDPRHPGSEKIFSVAPIVEAGEVQGYLYVVLESEEYAHAANSVWSSNALRLGATGLAAILIFAVSAGGLLFRYLTRRLLRLDASVNEFCEGGLETAIPVETVPSGAARDEIDRLANSFQAMSAKIVDQVQELKHTDTLRRQLIANVSHDLRTPLAALRGYVDTLLIKESSLSSAERRQYLEITRKSGMRLEKLIDELFELAKLEATRSEPRVEPFSLPELAHDVLRKFDLDAKEKGVCLEVDASPQVSFAVGEIGLIERVLENLIDNALRYTSSRESISIGISESGGRVTIQVSDTGAGIPPRDLPHIFDHFYRASHDSREEYQGSGLGLAITKRILELHESKIAVTSQPGRGTTFTFDLPSAASA
jgi:signal transduction histidine kinase